MEEEQQALVECNILKRFRDMQRTNSMRVAENQSKINKGITIISRTYSLEFNWGSFQLFQLELFEEVALASASSKSRKSWLHRLKRKLWVLIPSSLKLEPVVEEVLIR